MVHYDIDDDEQLLSPLFLVCALIVEQQEKILDQQDVPWLGLKEIITDI